MKRKKTAKKMKSVEDVEQITKRVLEVRQDTVDKQQHGKTLRVADLPDGALKELFVGIVKDAKAAIVCIVAFCKIDGTWDAQCGWPDVRDLRYLGEPVKLSSGQHIPPDLVMWRCENIRGSDEVLMMGEKIDQETAKKLFPDFSSLPYSSPAPATPIVE